ncbi:MAG: helix-turn-helix domain-containing protein [Polyangiaceae bacterium]
MAPRRSQSAGASRRPSRKHRLQALADRVRTLRTERGLTQRAAARLIGVGPPVVRRLEGGIANPSLAVLVSVARAFGVTLGYLFGKRGKRE